MNSDHQPDPALAAPLAALRGALHAHDAPPAVERALMAAFAARFPPRRWYHALSPRQWGMGAGSTTLVAVMALLLAMPAPTRLDGGPDMALHSVDEGAPFIALESIERIEQEPNPQLLEAEVPRTALASLGLPVNPETAGDSVRAEMLVGADGSPLALRLVSPPY